MRFAVDPTAPRLDETNTLSSFDDVAPILEGASSICSSIQDNDSEIWSLSSGGQFIRQTGVDSDRYFVVPAPEALEFLQDFADDETLHALREAGLFEARRATPTP